MCNRTRLHTNAKMYPSLTDAFNISKETKTDTVIQIEGFDAHGIEDFFMNAPAPEANAVYIGQKYFNLPGYAEMLALAQQRFQR